jgi:ABC-2 type transport system ATP-binding protein
VTDVPPITGAVLSAVGLGKTFGKKQALRDVGFRVAPGEIFGILGPNGAGKSTLIGILCGLLEPDSGRLEIFGRPFAQDRAAILGRMNIASPYASLPGQLTVWQNLSVYGELYAVERPAKRIGELLAAFGIAGQAHTLVRKLSSGQAGRVNLCKALLNCPDILLLDEPTVYLDPEIAAQTRALIARERESRGMTVVLTSHNLVEVEQLCDRVLVLSRGRAVALGSTLDVTRAILGESRAFAALDEVFGRLAPGEL